LGLENWTHGPVLILAPLDPGGNRYSRGTKYRDRRAKIEDLRAESGVGFLERGSQSPPHQLGGLGNAISTPSGVWSGAPVKIEFGAF